MADVQDEDQWLYGDEKDESKEDGEINERTGEEAERSGQENDQDKETPMEEGGGKDSEEKDGEDKDGDKDKEGDKEDGEKGDDDDSSDDDDLTVTIGTIKTQPDIIQAAPHGARFQPKAAPTTGLKDDDFTSPGKVNGVPVTEFNLDDLEDKPWRKPGADISDYFNYGFNEETWFKYCERQKRMRIQESGAGLTGLGISVTKPFGNTPSSIPVAIVNDNSKYGGSGSQRPKAGPPPRNKGMGQIDVIGGASNPKTSTIQVMTADRREYSNKVMMNGPPPPIPPSQPGYNDMEFGGNPYGDTYYGNEGNNFYGGGSYDNPSGWGSGGQPPMGGQGNWEGQGGGGGAPPNVLPVSGGGGYFDEDSVGAPPPSAEPEEERHRPRRSHRSRSRSPSRHRHSSRHPRSRSRSPSHRHKRKKSKRERDAD
ncbi:pre-mRNA 3'-end-processing factor FIP1-like [Penaeus chinensis]|uniref:pre-mRNA 3'-end-processing factor FIP1-like n=1 Tax=Penaeus chinensis TaxID=139456 RepID=UPI001FB56FAE|nr:pre-mRNA 3'-end-processing factor FIP1-like [Penaeus chinensis]